VCKKAFILSLRYIIYFPLIKCQLRLIFTVDYQPSQIEYITLIKIEGESKNVCELQAEIVFEPVEGNTRMLHTQHMFKKFLMNYYVLAL